ncbi:MAG: hypothetical protein IKH44_05285 [Bacteroidales bacterium]|nr:hypothetical protein [Bacteroidales bacterium]
MKETTNTGLIDLILDGGVLADEAMYHLLHHRLNHQLRQRFEVYEHRLLDDFEDVVDDFFFYLRDGKEGDDQRTYQSLQGIVQRGSFESWMLNTFRNYLSVRAAKEDLITHMELPTESVADIDANASVLTDEQKLSVASDLLAYAHQKLSSRDGFIFLRSMLTMLNKQKALPNEAMAKALGMTDVSYRVTVHRMKCNLAQYRSDLLRGEHFHLDEKHQQMARRIYDDFLHLYPTLLGYYCQAIDQLCNLLILVVTFVSYG